MGGTTAAKIVGPLLLTSFIRWMNIQNVNSGPVIRQARKRKGWSQQRLADEIGSSQAAVSRMENGDEVLTQADIAALCEALELSWSDFDPAQVA